MQKIIGTCLHLALMMIIMGISLIIITLTLVNKKLLMLVLNINTEIENGFENALNRTLEDEEYCQFQFLQ